MRRNVLLLLISVALYLPGFSQTVKPKILILGDSATEDTIYSILSTLTDIEVDSIHEYWNYDGSNVEEYDAFLFLTGSIYYEDLDTMVQEMIINQVSAGSGLMTIEWLGYYMLSGFYDKIAAIAPITPTSNAYYYEPDTLIKAIEHPITAGLPDSFIRYGGFNPAQADINSVKDAQVIYESNRSNDAVIAGKWGLGKTVHWNMIGDYTNTNIFNGKWDENSTQLLKNIVYYLIDSTFVEDTTEIPDTTVSIKNQKLEGSIQLFPNPANDYLRLTQTETEATLLLIDPTGRKIFEKKIGAEEIIPIHNISAGVYQYIVLDKKKKWLSSGKFWKE